MLKVQIESVSKDSVLIKKDVLDRLVYTASQVDKIEINESCKETKEKWSSLRGLWKGNEINDDLFLEVRRSLFNYEES